MLENYPQLQRWAEEYECPDCCAKIESITQTRATPPGYKVTVKHSGNCPRWTSETWTTPSYPPEPVVQVHHTGRPDERI